MNLDRVAVGVDDRDRIAQRVVRQRHRARPDRQDQRIGSIELGAVNRRGVQQLQSVIRRPTVDEIGIALVLNHAFAALKLYDVIARAAVDRHVDIVSGVLNVVIARAAVERHARAVNRLGIVEPVEDQIVAVAAVERRARHVVDHHVVVSAAVEEGARAADRLIVVAGPNSYRIVDHEVGARSAVEARVLAEVGHEIIAFAADQ